MTTWTEDELSRIGSAEELQLASRRRDGSLRRFVTVWVVRSGADLYVRTGWPAFVAFREALLPLPLAPRGYWTFDEFLRQGALFFLSEGRPISIEIPEGNRAG